MPRRPDPEDNEVGRRRPDPDSWARPPPIASIGPSRNHPSRFGSESDIPSPGPPGFHLPTSEIHSFEPANTRNSPVFHGNSDPATNSPFPLPNHIGQLVNNGVKSNRPAEDPAEYLLSPPMRFESTGEAFHRRLNSSVLVKLPPLHENEVPLNQTPTRAKPTTRPGNSQALGIAPLTNDRRGASTIQGYKTIRLSVIPYNAIQPDAQTGVNTTDFVKSFDENVSFTPKRLLDVENGVSILVTSQKFLSNHRFQELGDDGAVVVVTARTTAPIAKEDNLFFEERGQGLKEKIRSGDVRAFDAYSEIGSAGQAWRGILRRFMVAALDDVNGLRLGRQLELFIPFLTGYESYLIGQVIEALDQHPQKPEVDFILKIAFQNRNVSRILVQSARPRWDFFWHSYQAVSHNREFDAFGQIPLIGITSFPATENFPSTRNHVVASIARVVLGQGGWITRVLTGNRQGLNADHPERNIAQNLAPESNGSEAANRNQFGTYVGRIRTNQFRLHHRLPVDESIVRTFVGQPTSTMINNGVVHTFRQLAKHWHNMLDQPSGNFAHQRMEQLNPFETMRFHIPMVCVVLSNLRGRNRWDSAVLGPFMRNCQELTPTLGVTRCIEMVREMKENILLNVTAGIASVYDPLNSWLDAIIRSCEMIEEESKEVYQKVTSVEIGLRLGHDLMTQVTWKLPSEAELKESILLHIKGKPLHAPVNERRIRSALFLTTPRDKRTLIELVKLGHESTKPAQLLLGRVKTLLQREIRREALNEAIRGLSFGDYISSGNLVTEEWYWLEEGEKKAVYIYSGKIDGKETYRFVHVDSGYERFVSVSDGTMKYRVYVPVAESITRAQRCYMNIELEHGKKFSYSAFMEFPALRIALRRLAIISQIFCEELDNARINFLREVQRSNQTQVGIVDMEIGRTYYIYNNKEKSYEPFVCQKKYTPTDPEWQNLGRTKILTIPPQNMMVVGGGPTGLVTVIHCTESVLMGGGVMKLFEARDAFFAGGSTFERAQIVRLDARWIAMLRYHLGTGFEDIYIPASGETDAQLGNTLPTQGFVEITIKDLENMLHVEVSRMWSKGLIQCYTNSTAKYDHITNTLIKQGQHLKLDDGILRRFDPDGHPSSGYYSWKVVDLIYQKSLAVDDLKVGHEYGIFIRQENAVLPFKLTAIDLQSQTYTFTALKNGVDDVRGTMHTLPSVYPKGTRKHANVTKVVVECVQKGSTGGYTREELPMSGIETQKFTMDIGHTHVVECIGKQFGSSIHLSTTTYEPYGVCCIQGLKISMGMHNFGEKRFGNGLLDDFRSTNDQNTRIIGDFTKMVRQPRIAERMLELIKTDNWRIHFCKLVDDSKFPSLNELDPIVPKLRVALQWHANNARKFKRQTLQTRFFETGDNFYLGMEFTREYDKWKNETADALLASLNQKSMNEVEKKNFEQLKGTLMHHIDRLWYEACLEVIRLGDVYNPGARKRVPKLYIINSYAATQLVDLPVGESFRLDDKQDEKYEVLVKERNQILARNVEGYIFKMDEKTMVLREGNLTRGPDGNKESKVALATFPVGHYVNFRTVRLNNNARGYVFAFIGDEQSTPHFMRYSGLTGACINAMLVNEFVKKSFDGVPFMSRFATYAKETNWTNSEVVTRGTGSYYGRDGFLRPGFPYKDGIDYLHSKVIECMETGQDLNDILSRDWKGKFAAALIPKGMELNHAFISTFFEKTNDIIFNILVEEVKKDTRIQQKGLAEMLQSRNISLAEERSLMNHDSYWSHLSATIINSVDESTHKYLKDHHIEIAKRTEQTLIQIVEFARDGYHSDDRIVSEMFHQPKPVDAIVDDFAVEAQLFAGSLVMSASFAATSVALLLYEDQSMQEDGIGSIVGFILSVLSIIISFGTMTSVSRYKIRNEEARILFFEEKLPGVLKSVFAFLSKTFQDDVPDEINPFVVDLERKVEKFRDYANYYGVEELEKSGFNDAYNKLRQNVNDPFAIKDFQWQLAGKYIADIYHHNSYVQEYLVDVYKVCSDMLELLEQDEDRSRYAESSEHLFRRLTNFIPRLDKSLQRGHIYWGFLKHRRFVHWDIAVVFRYFWSLLWYASDATTKPLAPIQTETLGIIREARNVSANYHNTILRREIRDLEQLYWATRESDVSSLIFVTVVFVHILSWIFTISRILTFLGGPDDVTDASALASIGSTFGAILGALHFHRKLSILLRLWSILGGKVRTAKTSDDAASIKKVKDVTSSQILVTFFHFLAALAASIALPWSIFVAKEDDEGAKAKLAFLVALSSTAFATLALILVFIIEYRVRYDLSPRLGEYICEAFRDEIESMYTVLSKPMNDIETKQMQERETWEYVAREFLHKYRFDTVFAADRFGSILQYLQSGMDPRNSK